MAQRCVPWPQVCIHTVCDHRAEPRYSLKGYLDILTFSLLFVFTRDVLLGENKRQLKMAYKLRG